MDDQILDKKTLQEMPVDLNRPDPGWKTFFRKKIVIISGLIAIILIAAIFWFFLSKRPVSTTPVSNNVLVLIKGPTDLTSGNEAEYTITYRNGENADLISVSLEMLYPSGFKFKSATPASTSSSGQYFNLPIVKEGKDGQVVVRGKLSGSSGEDKEIKARLHYRLSNFNSEFAVEESIHTSILPPNLVMDLSGPVDVVNGQDATFTVNLTNVSGQDFDNLAIQLMFPTGFLFTSANPSATKNNNYWKVPKLDTNGTFSLELTGSFTGDPGEDKMVRADLGQIINNNFAPQISSSGTFKIIPSSLALEITSSASGFVKTGDTINYKIKYGNRGTIGLNNLIISVNLQGPSLDISRISASDAIVNSGQIIWKAATLSNLSLLAPSQRGEINFSVPVKENPNINIKNQVIKALATVSSDEITKATRAADLELKLISKLGLDATAEYVSGEAPLRVGKSTTFNVTLMLTNTSNDLFDTLVVASMPLPASSWKNVVVPETEKDRLTFDPNSGKIYWRIGNLSAFTGKFSPALKVTFQIVATPSDSNLNKVLKLLENVQATGTDAFVNQTVQSEKISLDTATIDDDVLNLKGTTVVP